ncbi:MAG: DUF3579 domain-containing protein [Thiobacillus sp.]
MLKSDNFKSRPPKNMDDANAPLIIRGMTAKGARFRPSDWADRLAGAFSAVDPNNRTNYSPYVQPTTLDGISCVVVDKQLRAADPSAYHFLQVFAESNELLTDNAD